MSLDHVTLTTAEVVEALPWAQEVWPDHPQRVGRIEGVVSGKRYGAMVPPSMIGDDLMCRSYLRMIAETQP